MLKIHSFIRNSYSASFGSMAAELEDSTHTEELWTLLVTEELNAPIEKIWKVASDFVNIGVWLPGMTSKLVSGEPQVPGVVRLVETPYAHAYERLLILDSDNHLLSYVVEDNTLNMRDLKGEFKLTQGSQPGTTVLSWGYAMPPNSSTSAEEVSTILGFAYRAGIDSLKAITAAQTTETDAKEDSEPAAALAGSDLEAITVTEKPDSNGSSPVPEVLGGEHLNGLKHDEPSAVEPLGDEENDTVPEKAAAVVDPEKALTSEVEKLSIAS